MELLNTKKYGGYDVHFLDTLSVNFECPVCRMAFREPIQTDCGHRLCLSCSEEIKIRNEGVLICPLDKYITDKAFSDKAYEREILQLKVKCGNFQNNCEWTGELKLLSNHLINCDYQEVKCTNEQCFTLLLRKELKNHMETHCIYRSVTCQYCYQKISYIELKIHFENCESFQLNCVNQCGARVLRKEMSSHITDDCTLTIISCQYINIGCNFKGMRKDQKAHANSSTQDHLSMAISKLVFLENKILTNENEATKKLSVLEKEMGKDQGECRKSSNEEMSTKLNALEDKINCLAKEVGMRKEHAMHANSSMQNHLSMAISKLEALENKMTLTVETLENKIASKLNALENKIASKMESFETKVASESIAVENKIKSEMESLETKFSSKSIELEKKITSKMESLETKISSESIALENKITLKVESFKNKNASEAVAFENKIFSKVDALKNELISKVDEQKDKIMLHEKNLEIIKAVLAVEMGQYQDEYRKSSKEEKSTILNVLEDKFNSLAKKMGHDQDEYRKLSNEEMSTKLKALEDKISCPAKEVGQRIEEMSTKLNALEDKFICLAKDVEHLNKRAPEPRILKDTVCLNEPTDASKLTRPVLEEEKSLGFREILKQTNERCRPK